MGDLLPAPLIFRASFLKGDIEREMDIGLPSCGDLDLDWDLFRDPEVLVFPYP